MFASDCFASQILLLLASCCLELLSAEMTRGNYSGARVLVMEAIVSARRSGDEYTEARAWVNMSRLERASRRWNAAYEAGEAALAVFERLGHKRQAEASRRGMAINLWRRGRLEAAAVLAERSRVGMASIGNEFHAALATQLQAIDLLAFWGNGRQRVAFPSVDSWRGSDISCRASGEGVPWRCLPRAG
mgnify:CR=1 FL=1